MEPQRKLLRMKRLAVALAFVFLLAPGAFPQGSPSSFQELVIDTASKADAGVVPVLIEKILPPMPTDLRDLASMPRHEWPTVIGSAFFINDHGYFVTAAHVLGGPPSGYEFNIQMKADAGFRNGGKFEIVAIDQRTDLAVCRMTRIEERFHRDLARKLNAPTYGLRPLKFAISSVKQGQIVAIAGFPLASWNSSYQLANIAATTATFPKPPNGSPEDLKLVQVSVLANGGNSGGPLLDIQSGDVLGMIVSKKLALAMTNAQGLQVAENSGLALAVPTSAIVDFLRANNIQFEFGNKITKEKGLHTTRTKDGLDFNSSTRRKTSTTTA